MWTRRLTWLGGIVALLGCVPVPASPDAGTDATSSEPVEDVLDSDEGAAPSDDGPPAPDVRADVAAEVASDVGPDASPDVAPDAPSDTPLDASPDARVDAAPDARDAAPDLPDAPDAARDVAADLPADRADAPVAMDAPRDVPAADAAPFDAPADDAAPPDGFITCGDAPVAADARRDDAGRPCGQNGQRPCPTAPECADGLGSVPTLSVCRPFGEASGPCFPGGLCGAGLRCGADGFGRCGCDGSSDSCGTAVGWACRELVSVSFDGYRFACCRGLGAACCNDSDCCGRTAGTVACRGGVCARTDFVCTPIGDCRTTPCCAPYRCELPDYRCNDGL